MSQVGISGGVLGILAIAWHVFKWINHRNIRSHCCGKEVALGIDVDTPKASQSKEDTPEASQSKEDT